MKEFKIGICKRVLRGGNNQLLVYLPKGYFQANEIVRIIKEADISTKQVLVLK